MITENNMNGELRFVISTRGRDGRYGPQSKDMSLSELIDVFTPEPASVCSPTTVIFPDLSALTRKIDAKIREHLNRFREEELAQDYDVLFNTWTQTGSIADPSNRSRRWEKVMDLSMEYILLAQKRMPVPKNFSLMQTDDVTEVATKGKMYCEALLFHIIARSAFDPDSLSSDITLRGYCKWLKNWLESYIGNYDYEELLLSAVIKKPEYYQVLQLLTDQHESLNPCVFLTNKLSNISRANDGFYNRDSRPVEMTCTLNFYTYSNVSWEMIDIFRDLHYRISRIENFLGILEEKGKTVSFSRTKETSDLMEVFLAQLED